jgi:hypothetical protein
MQLVPLPQARLSFVEKTFFLSILCTILWNMFNIVVLWLMGYRGNLFLEVIMVYELWV